MTLLSQFLSLAVSLIKPLMVWTPISVTYFYPMHKIIFTPTTSIKIKKITSLDQIKSRLKTVLFLNGYFFFYTVLNNIFIL